MMTKNYMVAKERIKDMEGIDEETFNNDIYPVYNTFDEIELEEVVKMYQGRGDHRLCFQRLNRIRKEIEASWKGERTSKGLFSDLDCSLPDEIETAFQNHRKGLWERAAKNIAAWRDRRPLPGYEQPHYDD